jgi:hypothetical protein
MIPDRFIVDTHDHAQRHVFKFQEQEIDSKYATLVEGMTSAKLLSSEIDIIK